jgi:protein disulfide-isomerase
LRSAKLPTLVELSSATYNDLMPTTGDPPLVAVAVFSPKAMGSQLVEAKKRFEDVARGWTERRKARDVKGRDVVWTWVDGDRWTGWAKSMYGVKAGAVPAIVVADHKVRVLVRHRVFGPQADGFPSFSHAQALSFWKTSIKGEPLSERAEDIYELIEDGIYTGVAKSQSSRTFVERVGDVSPPFQAASCPFPLSLPFVCAQAFTGKATSLKGGAASHPIITGAIVVLSWIGLWYLYKWCAKPIGPGGGSYAKYE